MKHRYAVFGAGRQGTAAIHDLLAFCDAESVLVVEPDAARREAARARIAKLVPRASRRVAWVANAQAAALRGTDVVLSCAPYTANLALTKLALEARVPFTDLGGNPATVAAQQRLARRARVAVVPDCGVSPGLSNILAVHCARTHACKRVEVRCGGLPLVEPDAKRNPLKYKLVFSPLGLISEYSGRVPVIRAGKLTSVPALGVVEDFDERHEASPTSNNSPQVVEYLRECGVEHYDYMTVRYRGHWARARHWKGQSDAVIGRRLERDPALRYDPRTDRDKLILRVRGWTEREGVTVGVEYRLDVAADRKTKFAAMELTTAWGITIVAHALASGRAKVRGFATPERFMDGSWVLAELGRRLAALKT